MASDPDPRFSFANERTFLAWNRTALALIGSGLVVAQFLDLGFKGGRLVVALPLMLLGAGVSVASLFRWRANEQAMRHDEPLPTSVLPSVVAIGVAALAVVAVILALLER